MQTSLLPSFRNAHTILDTPLLVRSAKLSRIGPSQVRKWETIAKRKVVFLFAAAPPFAAPPFAAARSTTTRTRATYRKQHTPTKLSVKKPQLSIFFLGSIFPVPSFSDLSFFSQQTMRQETHPVSGCTAQFTVDRPGGRSASLVGVPSCTHQSKLLHFSRSVLFLLSSLLSLSFFFFPSSAKMCTALSQLPTVCVLVLPSGSSALQASCNYLLPPCRAPLLKRKDVNSSV